MAPLRGSIPRASQASNRATLVTRSPQTNLQTYSTIGGFWGPELKFAGYDSLIISGKSPSPVYIWIDDDKVELRDARHLWGKDTFETQKLIKQEIQKCLSHMIFSAAFKIDDRGFNFRAYHLMEKLGMDTMTVCAVSAFTIDLYQKGILTDADTGGLHLEFGNRELALRLIEQIARREGKCSPGTPTRSPFPTARASAPSGRTTGNTVPPVVSPVRNRDRISDVASDCVVMRCRGGSLERR